MWPCKVKNLCFSSVTIFLQSQHNATPSHLSLMVQWFYSHSHGLALVVNLNVWSYNNLPMCMSVLTLPTTRFK